MCLLGSPTIGESDAARVNNASQIPAISIMHAKST